jgi:LysR family nitrogen assimilation transcriptional regulator
MNIRRLQYFVKIVDIGSLTQAADVLHVAQPALSQQLATLEAEVRQQLLLRTTRGVTPTEAGKILYRHAQMILRQCEQAKSEMSASNDGLHGAVSVGLAPGTAAAGLALPLLKATRARHPGILLYLNETYGSTLSEMIMNGRMDMAVLYGGRVPVHGLSFLPLLDEELYLVGPNRRSGFAELDAFPSEVTIAQCAHLEFYLARPYNVVRRMVDEAFAAANLKPNVVAEIESASTLTSVISEGLGMTILPESMANQVLASCPAWKSRLVDPAIVAPLALCQSDYLPLSEPAQAIKEILLELVAKLPHHRLELPKTRKRGSA